MSVPLTPKSRQNWRKCAHRRSLRASGSATELVTRHGVGDQTPQDPNLQRPGGSF